MNLQVLKDLYKDSNEMKYRKYVVWDAIEELWYLEQEPMTYTSTIQRSKLLRVVLGSIKNLYLTDPVVYGVEIMDTLNMLGEVYDLGPEISEVLE